jgi:hypothetical protein
MAEPYAPTPGFLNAGRWPKETGRRLVRPIRKNTTMQSMYKQIEIGKQANCGFFTDFSLTVQTAGS